MKQGVNKLDHNAAAIKRWRSRLKRAMSMLDKLERQRKRLETVKPPKAEAPKRPRGHFSISDPATFGDAIRESIEDQKPKAPKTDDLAIPGFLKRPVSGLDATRQRSIDADADKAEQIKAEQEATKKAKAKGRIEKMKAKQRGDLKRMPLVGKAALAAINQKA